MTRYGRKGRVVVKDHGYKALVHATKLLGGAALRVGIVANQPASSGSASLLEVASHHEFGAPRARIPERSFLRSTIDEQRSEIDRRFRAAEASVVRGKATPVNALAKVGSWLVTKVREKIDTGPFAPLAPSTIRRKGHSRPLFETGLLRAAINYRVDMVRTRGRKP